MVEDVRAASEMSITINKDLAADAECISDTDGRLRPKSIPPVFP